MQRSLAPATRVPVNRIKKRPRGRSFEPGNGFGSATRYKKGESGNPSGRPACKEISKALRELLATNGLMKPRTNAEKLAVKWFLQSLAGNIPAMISLAERCEGRPAIALSITNENDPLIELIAAMHEESRRIGPPEGWHVR